MKLRTLFFIILLMPLHISAAQYSSSDVPPLPADDRIRIAEAFRLADVVQDNVWDRWSDVHFALLLVTPEHEFLIRHPRPSDDFVEAGYDSLLQSTVYVRSRTLPPNLLATFPAVGGVPTVVIGQPENTGKTSSSWVVTALHEHFHQLQTSQPGYYDAVNGLNLARGDQSGMWMLNYAFPYDSARVNHQFRALGLALRDAVESRTRAGAKERTEAYMALRRKLKESLNVDDYNYFSLQLWQEGVARYTELQVAEAAAAYFEPSTAFRSLPDFASFEQISADLKRKILEELNDLSLSEKRRVVFYPIGAAEALLLDEANPAWKERYHAEKFYLERYLDPAR